MTDVADVLVDHKLAERDQAILLSSIHQSLDVFGLVFLDNLGWYQPELILQMVHYQSGHAAIAIHPRVNRHQLIVCIKTQEILADDIGGSHQLLAAFVQQRAKLGQTGRDLLEIHVGTPTNARRDAHQPQIALGSIKATLCGIVLPTRILHHQG